MSALLRGQHAYMDIDEKHWNEKNSKKAAKRRNAWVKYCSNQDCDDNAGRD